MTQPKRVCHIVQTLYAMDSRIRKQVEALANAGFDVDVVCLKEVVAKPKSTPDSVRFFYAPLGQKKGGKLRYVFEYLAFFLYASCIMVRNIGRRYAVIHVSTMPDFLVFSTALPKLFGSRVLLDIHDPMPELFMSKGGMEKENTVVRLLKWQERISFRFANHLMTVSQAMKNRVARVAAGRDISVIMNLPDCGPTPQTDAAEREGSRNGTFTLVYTGTLSPTYGLSLIIEGVSHLRNRIPELRLMFVGGGDDAEALSDLANELGLQDIVEFAGWVSFTELPDILARADVGVSSLKNDVLTDMCFNNKSAEYVAMGLPAVVTRTSALQQHFPEGVVRFFEAGSHESFEEAIIELHDNPDLRAEMSRRGVEFSKIANWSSEKAKYLRLVGQLGGDKSETDVRPFGCES